MTRREFLLASAAVPLAALLPHSPDPRLRAVAACRRVWHRFDPAQRRMIDAAEQYALGRIDARRLWESRYPLVYGPLGVAGAAAENAAYPPDQDGGACAAACEELCRRLAGAP